MFKIKIFVSILFINFTLFSSLVFAEDLWKFEVIPYAWLAGIDGDLLIDSNNYSTSSGPSDVFSDGNIGGSILVNAEFNNFLLQLQLDSISLDSDNLDNISGKLENDTFLGQLSGGYEFEILENVFNLGVLGALKFVNMQNGINFNGSLAEDRTLNYQDLLLVLNPELIIFDDLIFNVPMGVSLNLGDSESLYEIQPQLKYFLSEDFLTFLGYRITQYDVSTEERGIDLTIQGFQAGLGISF